MEFDNVNQFDDSTDRFFGLIHNYAVTKSGDFDYYPPVPHPYVELDEPLSRLCDDMEKNFSKELNSIVTLLANRELNFRIFANALESIIKFNSTGLTYSRVIGAIAVCGFYAKRLVDMEESGQLPVYYDNAERYRNQMNQAILYMSKILDMQVANQWNLASGLSFDGFCQYVVENAENVEENNERWITGPVIIAAAVGITGIVLCRYLFF